MPNWCNNSVVIKAPRKTLNKIRCLVRSDELEFDFDKIIPMPDYIYRGTFGPEEEKIYGKNNWYDWSNENWGTKGNSEDAICENYEDELSYNFYTAWSPCEPVIRTLAEMFPEAKLSFQFEEPGCCYFGEQEYENGHMTYSAEGDYHEYWFSNYEEDSKDEFERAILKERDNPGIVYSIENEKNYGPVITYNFTYQDTDDARIILLEGTCWDARAERKEFLW